MTKKLKLGFVLLLVLMAEIGFTQDLEFKNGTYYKKVMLHSGIYTEYYEKVI